MGAGPDGVVLIKTSLEPATPSPRQSDSARVLAGAEILIQTIEELNCESQAKLVFMKTFSDQELKLIRQLKDRPAQTLLRISDACPLHSVCTPLPLFRVYKIDDTSFQAEWNEHHSPGMKQVFRFEEAN